MVVIKGAITALLTRQNKGKFPNMVVHFEEDEFTARELIHYFKTLFQRQFNGSPFTQTSLSNWIRQGRVPELYGGYQILAAKRYGQLGGLQVITMDGLSRKELPQEVGGGNYIEQLVKAQPPPALGRPNSVQGHRHRTRLYYQILEKAGRSYQPYLSQINILPQYYKQAGGKGNQKARTSRKQ